MKYDAIIAEIRALPEGLSTFHGARVCNQIGGCFSGAVVHPIKHEARRQAERQVQIGPPTASPFSASLGPCRPATGSLTRRWTRGCAVSSVPSYPTTSDGAYGAGRWGNAVAPSRTAG